MTSAVSRRVGGMTVLNLAANGVRVALSFITLILASRWLGPDGFGKISLILAYTTYLLTVLPLGFDQSLPYFASRAGPAGAARVAGAALRLSLAAGAAVVAAVALILGPVLRRAGMEDLYWPVLIFLAQMELGAILNILFGFLRGVKSFVPYVVSEQLLFPALHLLALVLAVRILGAGYLGYAAGYALASACCVAYVGASGWRVWRALRAPAGRGAPRGGWPAWLAFSLPLAALGGLEPLLRSLSTMQAGWWLPPAEVGKYAVAARLIFLVQFLQLAVWPLFSPFLSDLFQRRARAGFRGLYQTVNGWCAAWAMLVAGALAAAAGPLLALFGPGYAEGTTACLLLTLPGAVVEGGFGAARVSLVMAGRNRINAVLAAAALPLHLALGAWLIPRFGVSGVGLTFSLAYGGLGLVRVLWFWRLFGVPPLGAAQARRLSLLGAFAALAAWAVPGAGLSPAATAALTAGVFTPAFALAFWRDRGVFTEALARLRASRRKDA